MAASSTILFAGGGTGGHLFPGIAVAEELRRQNSSLRTVFIGSDRDVEAMIANQHHLEHRNLPVESLARLRKNPWRFLRRNWQAWRDSERLIREIQPSAVVGLGGFASAPLIWVAGQHRIPIFLLEQNVIPGKTNRWLSRLADSVCVSFEETVAHLKHARNVVVTGNPVRQQIAALCARDLTRNAPEPDTKSLPQLLILGGSQGADSLNAAVVPAILQRQQLFKHWKVIHQTGPRDVDWVRRSYHEADLNAEVEAFYHDLTERLPNASFVISRAGATSLAELACAGLPMILLPFPQAADDHQTANARVFADQGAAYLVQHARSAEQTTNALLPFVEQLASDASHRRLMRLAARRLARPDAAAQIAKVIVTR